MTHQNQSTSLLPTPEIINISLQRRETNIGEIIIEYKLPENNETPISGVIVFLRPVNDEIDFPRYNLSKILTGKLSQNDNHRTFMPPKRGKHAQIQILVPLYVTYYAGIATYKIHEHSTIIPKDPYDSNLILAQLEDIQSFEISNIKELKKTFPAKLELKKPGNLRIEDEPPEDEGPTYLSEQSKIASQQYRLTETFIDEFRTTDNINFTKSFNISLIPGATGSSIKPEKDILFADSVEIINGLRAPGQPTTFILPVPLETPDIYKYTNITWNGKGIKVYVATGYNSGDVTDPEDFREIVSGGDLRAAPNEDTLNLRVDFIEPDAFISGVTVHYQRYEPSIILTKTIVTERPFNRAVSFINADNLEKVFLTVSNDGGKTFISPTEGEGLDLFEFKNSSNEAIVKIELFGHNIVEGYSISTGLTITPPPDAIGDVKPLEF